MSKLSHLEARPFRVIPKTIVIKIGSASVVSPKGNPRRKVLNAFVRQAAELRLRGNNVVFVVSGAVALGLKELGLARSPLHSPLDKAHFASIGQPVLMNLFRYYFKKHGLKPPGQGLLESIHLSMADSEPRYNIRDVLMRAFADPGAIPVLNENDYASRVELKKLDENDPNKIGDNDRLACRVADLVDADRLFTISTHCLYDRNPSLKGAKPIKFLNFAAPQNGPISMEGTSSSGTGGMDSKIDANRRFVFSGRCGQRIANVMNMKDVLENGLCRAFYDDDVVGTLLVCARPFNLSKGQPCPGARSCGKAPT